MRKIIWFSIVFLVLIFLCMPGLADEDWTYRIEEGLAYLTAYTGSEPEVTVPQDVDGFPVFGLDKDSVPTFVEKITVPVAVSAIADNAMHEGIAVQALHGAYALQWAEEHHCQATDLSKPRFTSLIVDLTGSDYRQTADGYSLGPALGKSLSSEVAIYLPETGKAWGIIKLTRQGDRYLAEVVEAEEEAAEAEETAAAETDAE